jgi:signal peptidase I
VDAVSLVIIVGAVIILLSVLFTNSGKAPSLLGYSAFRVMTGSMEPTIPTNSLIVVEQVEPSTLQEGDIISFYSRDPMLSGSVNTHRILSVEQDGEQYTFTTQGDANNVADLYTTRESDIVGKVVFISHTLGVCISLLSNPLVFVPLVILPLIILLVSNLWRTVTLARDIAQEEDEQAVREALETLRKKRQAVGQASEAAAQNSQNS